MVRIVRRRLVEDRGSSVIEFSMISVLLVLLLFAVLQVAALFYVRSVTAAAAADGARYAANADVDPAAGGPRASMLIAHGIGSRMSDQLPCQGQTVSDPGSQLLAAEVHCQGRIRSLLLPIGAFVRVDVTARSLKDPP
ncbi:MAG TPA: TadE/TadG family type IV pilus assembly protein [Jatrophihabitans sp.]|nr:TadE/TadG family type IV pilus assembly protein [Jatrophihabitans sp.]